MVGMVFTTSPNLSLNNIVVFWHYPIQLQQTRLKLNSFFPEANLVASVIHNNSYRLLLKQTSKHLWYRQAHDFDAHSSCPNSRMHLAINACDRLNYNIRVGKLETRTPIPESNCVRCMGAWSSLDMDVVHFMFLGSYKRGICRFDFGHAWIRKKFENLWLFSSGGFNY